MKPRNFMQNLFKILIGLALIGCNMVNSLPMLTSADENTLFPFFQNDQAGYIDVTGKFVIQPQYDHAASFHEGLASVELNKQWGYINTQGEMVIEPSFKSASDFHEKRARVKTDDQYGFIDPAGRVVIPAEFDDAADFSEGLAKVLKCTAQKQCLWINLNFTWGTITYPTGGEQSFIDVDGNPVIAFDYSFARSFHEGLAGVREGDQWGYIDQKGAMVIPPQYAGASDFSDGLAAVKLGERWGYIDKTGRMMIQSNFEDVAGFSEGLAAIRVGGKWGYIDKTGNAIIQPQFDGAGKFMEGMAAVKVDGQWGYIDKTGAIVIQPQFSIADDFNGGIASVWLQGQDGKTINAYINTKGEFITGVPISASADSTVTASDPAQPNPASAPDQTTTTYSFTVDARSSTWLDTGIFIEVSDEITILASGTIDFGGVESGPDGNRDLEPGFGAIPALPYGILAGVIGSGNPFAVGSFHQETAQNKGNLMLLINDAVGQYADNSGQFSVTITITKGK